MSLQSGYLLIADISGYTAYLTSTELEHANPILRSLLEALVTEVGEPLRLWRMEGDAVLAYSTQSGFPSGQAFLTICENLYSSFANRRTDIRANTTCPCNACANIGNLDLKILAHYGQFEEVAIGPMTDISGTDAILVHLMAKTDVKKATGINSYALFSQSAIDQMKLGDIPMISYATSFEHFGEIEMRAYDLAKAWEQYRSTQARAFIPADEAVYVHRHRCKAPLRIVWEHLVSPELKQVWMDMRKVSVTYDGPRLGNGSRYHCVHDAMAFTYWVTDWRPFDYFSTRILDPMHEGMENAETYSLTQDGDEVEICYAMGPLVDGAGQRNEAQEREVVDFLSGFWPQVFARMDVMMAEAAAAADAQPQSTSSTA
jgi:hypothetical protein